MLITPIIPLSAVMLPWMPTGLSFGPTMTRLMLHGRNVVAFAGSPTAVMVPVMPRPTRMYSAAR